MSKNCNFSIENKRKKFLYDIPQNGAPNAVCNSQGQVYGHYRGRKNLKNYLGIFPPLTYRSVLPS